MTDLQSNSGGNVSTAGASQGELVRLPLGKIRRNPNIDPRKGRNTAAFAAIRVSIREQGVLQAIVVRPIEGADVPYEVVAGNTRFSASEEEGLFDIPAMIRQMTDAEARSAAAIENLQRADLTPIEEAWHCVRLLEDSGNDHDEVCRILGWSRPKLDGRVLLSKCCDEVAAALVEKQIKIGHAELLAPMVEDEQRVICKAIIKRQMTVQATRERLAQLTPLISSARFDTTACTGCAHNSQGYADLFSASVGDAKCQNSKCWQEKTQQLIDVRMVEAQEEYGLVHTDLTLPTDGYARLTATGGSGVGSAQLNACAACPRYGAVVTTTKGREGEVMGGYCFDKVCHSEKTSAYQEIVAAANGNSQPQEAPAAIDIGTEQSPASNPKPASSKVKATAKPQDIKRSIKKVAFSMYAKMGQQAIQSSRSLVLAVSIVSLYLDLRSDVPSEEWTRLEPVIKFPTGLSSYNRAEFEVELARRPVGDLDDILNHLAALTVLRRDSNDAFAKSLSGAQSLAFIEMAGMDATEHFSMNEEYLKALTKSGIVADCKASGFDVKYDEVKGDKEFAKLAAGKVDDLIKAILAFTDFTWKGYLPETMKPCAHDGSGTPKVA